MKECFGTRLRLTKLSKNVEEFFNERGYIDVLKLQSWIMHKKFPVQMVFKSYKLFACKLSKKTEAPVFM